MIRQTRSEGEFSKILENVVAIDDARGLIIFSFLLAIIQALYGHEDGLNILWLGSYELGGVIPLGLLLGIPMAYMWLLNLLSPSRYL